MTDKPKKNPKSEEVAKLEAQVNELTDAIKRERADAINLRRRHDEEISGLKTRLKSSVVSELLPVIDNFELALKHVPKELEGNTYVKGVEGVVKQFERTLADMGVERIKTVGEPFNPELHEAVSLEEGEGKHEIVSEELRGGYTLNGHVIRHAVVKVKMQ